MGAILRAHPVRGELHIQCRADREVATAPDINVTGGWRCAALVMLLIYSGLCADSFVNCIYFDYAGTSYKKM